MDIEVLNKLFKDTLTKVDFASIRFFGCKDAFIEDQKGSLLPLRESITQGVMIQIMHNGGMGYGATADLTPSGVRKAYKSALLWAERSSGMLLDNLSFDYHIAKTGHYQTHCEIPWESVSLSDKIERVKKASQDLASGPHAADWLCSLWYQNIDSFYLCTKGSSISQHRTSLTPQMSVTAHDKSGFQTRTFGGYAYCAQAGLEHLDRLHFDNAAKEISLDSERLLKAENCPQGTMDIVLSPDQMILQIHESIGHPIELDRILGDERNYAGSSFVSKEMFGSYQYGSSLLNVVYDPAVKTQMASFAFDDEGEQAEKKSIIEDGILVRGLGGALSQKRLGVDGVACSRSVSWNRPPIDRMANLNLVPGQDTLEDLFSGVEKGVYMRTNNSWSIDDHRNKFQFGCEYGQLIENGKLTKIVKSPGYRGISANFWRNLTGVGDKDTALVMGTPFCGKGEPNQAIGVGHASPACRFSNVEVFGGES